MSITFTVENDEGEEIEYELPSKKEVCQRCEGHGTHLNPSIGEHAYSQEEFEREFDDEEKEAYFTRGGMYDVPCKVCKGARVVDVVDDSNLSTEEVEILKIYEERLADDAAYDAMCAEERRMGA